MAAVTFSVNGDEHYLSKPGTTLKIARLELGGPLEGTFEGEFEHETAGTVSETVTGKGAFRGQLQ